LLKCSVCARQGSRPLAESVSRLPSSIELET
jgi:hypothetical protein